MSSSQFLRSDNNQPPTNDLSPPSSTSWRRGAALMVSLPDGYPPSARHALLRSARAPSPSRGEGRDLQLAFRRRRALEDHRSGGFGRQVGQFLLVGVLHARRHAVLRQRRLEHGADFGSLVGIIDL